MGDGAEMLLEQEMRQARAYHPFFDSYDSPKRARDVEPKWVTEQGETLLVKDMDTQHIENAIKKLEREDREPYLPLYAELIKREEEAQALFKILGI